MHLQTSDTAVRYTSSCAQGFEEPFGFGVVVGIALGRHTDLHAHAQQALGIRVTGIVHAAIGVVNESWRNVTCGQCLFESIQS
jgi:hypothetical protein